METLEAVNKPVTITRVYDLLTLKDDMIKSVDLLKNSAKKESLEVLKQIYPDRYAALLEITASIKLEQFHEKVQENPDADYANFNPEATQQDIEELIPAENVLEVLPNDSEIPDSWNLAVHWVHKYMNQPDDQREGVVGTIFNYLNYFTDPDIAAVFCADDSNVEFTDLDKGKIICVSMPQIYQIQRDYIFTFLKYLYYTHAISRFDIEKKHWGKFNQLIFFADEAQNIVAANEDGMADYNVIDKIREAQATVVWATQSITSFGPRMKKQENVKTLLLNLKSQYHFQVADNDAAEGLSKYIGKRRIKSYSHSYSQGGTMATTTITEKDEAWFRPEQLTELKEFECVMKHPRGEFQKITIPPVDDEGNISEFYLKKKLLS